MTSLSPRTRRAAAVVLAVTGVLGVPAAFASAKTVTKHTHPKTNTHTNTTTTTNANTNTNTNNSRQLPTQNDNGYYAACGSASDIEGMVYALNLVGIGNVALYTGPQRTGQGCDVITGNGLAIGTDFQIKGMTAANVDNHSDAPVAVYSDQSDNLDAVVPAGADSDIAPVDVNFAAYPEGTMPPPDDRGLNPAAVFTFQPAA